METIFSAPSPTRRSHSLDSSDCSCLDQLTSTTLPIIGATQATTPSTLSKRHLASGLHEDCEEHSVLGSHDDPDEKFGNNHSRSFNINQFQQWFLIEVQKWQRRIPFLQRIVHLIQRVPPKHRYAFIAIWILWKVIALIITIRVVMLASRPTGRSNNGNNNYYDNTVINQQRLDDVSPQLKILYIVTTLAEYNTGTRATVKGQDRLAEVLLPVLVDSVDSMIHPPYYYQVDVYLILGYKLLPERLDYIRQQLPPGVGLQVWDDASPLGFDNKHDEHRILDNTRALSRQHRYVIKDKLPYYNFFIAMEDDMRITGDHVHHFIKISHAIDQLRAQAPVSLPNYQQQQRKNHRKIDISDPFQQSFHGPMTQRQLERLIPGFIRVEVLLNETAYGAQTKLDPIPLDYGFSSPSYNHKGVLEQHLDPTVCCHVHMNPNKETPVHPSAKDVIIWETSVKALSLRRLPASSPPNTSLLDWVVLLPGPGKRLPPEEFVEGYWSGRIKKGTFDQKPSPGMPDLIAQQGGWMASRNQVWRLETDKLCQASFLPPFDEPMYYKDGQESMNVEFWSGGYQLFTGVRGGCNMQRIVSLRTPKDFSKSLIYHVANNKQRQLSRQRMLRADHLLGQLNTIRKAAEEAFLSEKPALPA